MNFADRFTPPGLTQPGYERLMHWLLEAPNLITSAELPPPLLPAPPTHNASNAGTLRLPRRLGQQFEKAVMLFLQSCPDITDFHSNIQIRENQHTLGELDLLVKIEHQWWHVELALKFYLKDPKRTGLDAWVGPSRHDNLAKKWIHMRDQQSQLCTQRAALPYLRDRGIENVHSSVWVKGWLFCHPDEPKDQILPKPINPNHQRGWWIYLNEARDYLSRSYPHFSFTRVPRPLWLLPISEHPERLLTLEQLIHALQSIDQPEYVWIVLGRGASRQVISRGFIAPESWSPTDAE